MLKVVKFGGSSLADAAQFKKVAQIIRSDPARRYVVASAPGKRDSHDEKVTDLLLQCYHLAKDKKNIDEILSGSAPGTAISSPGWIWIFRWKTISSISRPPSCTTPGGTMWPAAANT